MRTVERLIDILLSVNPTAIDNDDGKPGEFLAEACHEAAEALRAGLESLPSRPLDPDHAADDEAMTCLNVLSLSTVAGGIGPKETPSTYLLRILNELVSCQRA